MRTDFGRKKLSEVVVARTYCRGEISVCLVIVFIHLFIHLLKKHIGEALHYYVDILKGTYNIKTVLVHF